MNIKHYAEKLADAGYYEPMIQEYSWSDKSTSITDEMFEATLSHAARADVQLSNVESFDYDQFFHNIYSCTEKGLS